MAHLCGRAIDMLVVLQSSVVINHHQSSSSCLPRLRLASCREPLAASRLQRATCGEPARRHQSKRALGPGVSCPYTKWRSNTLYRGSKLSGPQLHPRRWLPRSPLIRTQDLMRTTRVERGEWASYTLVQVPLSLPRGREAHREERQRSQILLPSRPPCKNYGHSV